MIYLKINRKFNIRFGEYLDHFTAHNADAEYCTQAAEGGAGADAGERDGARRAAGARQHLGQRAQGPAHPEVTLTATLLLSHCPFTVLQLRHRYFTIC